MAPIARGYLPLLLATLATLFTLASAVRDLSAQVGLEELETKSNQSEHDAGKEWRANGTKSRRSKAGSTCKSSRECVEDYCVTERGSGKYCSDQPVQAGEMCDGRLIDKDECEPGYSCQWHFLIEEYTCLPLRKEREACMVDDDCPEDLLCVLEVCAEERLGEKQKCKSDSDCESGKCKSEKCKPKSKGSWGR